MDKNEPPAKCRACGCTKFQKIRDHWACWKCGEVPD